MHGIVIGQEANEPIVEYVWVKAKLEELAKDSQAVITLRSEEIKKLPIRDLVDLLSLLPGVHVSRKGPLGAAFDISLRGGNFEQTLILIDGLPWNNPQTGHFNADLPLQLEDVVAVQLIRGGNGARYGSAFAGAVNIQTNRQRSWTACASIGEYGLLMAGLSGGIRLGRQWHLNLGLASQQSRGDKPGREHQSRYATLGLNWEGSNNTVSMDFRHLNKDFGADGFYAPYPSYEETTSNMFSLNWRLGSPDKQAPLRLMFCYQIHDDYFELDRRSPAFFQNRSETKRLMLMAESAFSLGGFDWKAGLDITLDNMNSLAMGQAEEWTKSAFINGKFAKRDWTLDLGMRSELWADRAPKLVGYAGMCWQATPEWLIKVSLGNSNRKPSFTERLYRSPSNRGDQALKTESGRSIELSLVSPRSFGVCELALFYRHQERTIDWVNIAVSPAVLWQAVNLAAYSVKGLELGYTVDLGRNRLQLALERTLSAGAPGVGYASKYGFRIPDLTLRSSGHLVLDRRLSASWAYQFKRLMADGETAHLLDMRLTYRLSPALALTFLVNNLLDTFFEEIKGVAIPGRCLSLGIRYQ